MAIKVLPEAKAISQLNHPHICTLYDVGEQDGINYLVMEYIEGEKLAERLKKGALPLEKVLEYGIQIADGLDTAHRAGIVHRDLKPGNAMLTKSGVKLLDFGLAKQVEDLAVSDRQPGMARDDIPYRGSYVGGARPWSERGALRSERLERRIELDHESAARQPGDEL